MVSLLVMMSPCAQLYTTHLKLFGEHVDRVHSHREVPIDGVITCSDVSLRHLPIDGFMTCSGISLRYFTNMYNRHLFYLLKILHQYE